MKDNAQIEAEELALWEEFAKLAPSIDEIIKFRNACNHQAARDAAHLAILRHPDHDDHHIIMVAKQTYCPATKSPAKRQAITMIMADPKLKARNLTLLMENGSGVSDQIRQEVLTAKKPNLEALIYIACHWEDQRDQAIARIKSVAYSVYQILGAANQVNSSSYYWFIGEIILARANLTIDDLRYASVRYPTDNILQALFDHPQVTMDDLLRIYGGRADGKLRDKVRTRILAECPERRRAILTNMIVNRKGRSDGLPSKAADQLLQDQDINIEHLRTILNLGNLPPVQANQFGRAMLDREQLSLDDFELVLKGAPNLKNEVMDDKRYKKLRLIAAVGEIEY